MNESVAVDMFTEDSNTGEFVLHILEAHPWPTCKHDWETRLRKIQDQILDTFDAIVDGGVAKRFPETKGGRFRIQVNSPQMVPAQVANLINDIDRFVHDVSNEYGKGIVESQFVSDVRVVVSSL